MRLLDYMVVAGVTPPESVRDDGARALVYKALHSQVVLADNVTSYYYEGSSQEEWLWDVDFPNLAPPFKDMWVETTRPLKIVSEVNGVLPGTHLAERWGAQMMTAEVTNKEEVGSFLLQIEKAMTLSMSEDTKSAVEAWKKQDLRWIVSANLFAQMGTAAVFGPVCVSMFPIKGDGSIVVTDRGKPAILSHAYLTSKMEKEPPAVVHDYLNECVNYLKPLMLAICFMNCSNVELVEYKHPRHVRRQLARASSASSGVEYKTLWIEPMRKQAMAAAAEAGSPGDSKKALHIVRGHFADYRKSGLFGKYKGIYWWDSHVRGAKEVGEVVKDYAVKV